MIYSLAIYLYMLLVILLSPFHEKARLMVKGHINTFRILRRRLWAKRLPVRTPRRSLAMPDIRFAGMPCSSRMRK